MASHMERRHGGTQVDRAVAADARWDDEGRRLRAWDPRGRPQTTYDLILQVGRSSIFQGGVSVAQNLDLLNAVGITLVVNCTMNLNFPYGTRSQTPLRACASPCPRFSLADGLAVDGRPGPVWPCITYA